MHNIMCTISQLYHRNLYEDILFNIQFDTLHMLGSNSGLLVVCMCVYVGVWGGGGYGGRKYLITSPRRGLRGIVFTLSVCVSFCVCVYPANMLIFYFSAIRRDIDLKFIQDTYKVVLKNIDLHRLKLKVTGTVHCFLKVQSYHKTEP